MKIHLLKRVTWFLLVAIAFGLCAIPVNASAEDIELTERQRNAIAMVNYITVLTQEMLTIRVDRTRPLPCLVVETSEEYLSVLAAARA